VKIIKYVIIYILLSVILTVGWQQYEIWKYGEIKADSFDSLVALILTISVTINFMLRDYIKEIE
jgi:hypothetical protein